MIKKKCCPGRNEKTVPQEDSISLNVHLALRKGRDQDQEDKKRASLQRARRVLFWNLIKNAEGAGGSKSAASGSETLLAER